MALSQPCNANSSPTPCGFNSPAIFPPAMASKPSVIRWQYLRLPPLPLLLTSCLSLTVQVLRCTQVVPLHEDTALNAITSAGCPGNDTVGATEAFRAIHLPAAAGSVTSHQRTPPKLFSEGAKGLSLTFLLCLGKKSKTSSLSLTDIWNENYSLVYLVRFGFIFAHNHFPSS